ncbi:unnamed protein product [Psylliodes chrysocephalus]|uniref:HAT C-terminal dimerisation domain-containing protein n=1 Tax=Psylliodes chrysocephalus TaxID=3402493 RepID=A0A9P0CX25_9CUCU|nr:unnamed protein product [Psylliodes chrysocephala]
MSGERYLTASSVILLTDGLLNVFETLQKQDFMPEIQSVITTIIQGIKTRLGDLESSLSLTLATFLDLRFKNLGFSNNQVPERAKMNPSGIAQSKAIIEVQRYLEEPPISKEQDTLKLWKNNAYNFPNLAEVVKTKVVTIATSVPC